MQASSRQSLPFGGKELSRRKTEERIPTSPEKLGDRPGPYPLPPPIPSRPLIFPEESAQRVLKEILVRLDGIEKRLENIEKLLGAKMPK